MALCVPLYVDGCTEVIIPIFSICFLFQLQLIFGFPNFNTAFLRNIFLFLLSSVCTSPPVMELLLMTAGSGGPCSCSPSACAENDLLFLRKTLLQNYQLSCIPLSFNQFSMEILLNRSLSKLHSNTWKSMVLIFLLFCSVL